MLLSVALFAALTGHVVIDILGDFMLAHDTYDDMPGLRVFFAIRQEPYVPSFRSCRRRRTTARRYRTSPTTEPARSGRSAIHKPGITNRLPICSLGAARAEYRELYCGASRACRAAHRAPRIGIASRARGDHRPPFIALLAGVPPQVGARRRESDVGLQHGPRSTLSRRSAKRGLPCRAS